MIQYRNIKRQNVEQMTQLREEQKSGTLEFQWLTQRISMSSGASRSLYSMIGLSLRPPLHNKEKGSHYDLELITARGVIGAGFHWRESSSVIRRTCKQQETAKNAFTFLLTIPVSPPYIWLKTCMFNKQNSIFDLMSLNRVRKFLNDGVIRGFKWCWAINSRDGTCSWPFH